MLVGGQIGKPGDVVELPDGTALNIIAARRGMEWKAEPGATVAGPATQVEVRDPQPEVREPEVSRSGKQRANKL